MLVLNQIYDSRSGYAMSLYYRWCRMNLTPHQLPSRSCHTDTNIAKQAGATSCIIQVVLSIVREIRPVSLILRYQYIAYFFLNTGVGLCERLNDGHKQAKMLLKY